MFVGHYAVSFGLKAYELPEASRRGLVRAAIEEAVASLNSPPVDPWSIDEDEEGYGTAEWEK